MGGILLAASGDLVPSAFLGWEFLEAALQRALRQARSSESPSSLSPHPRSLYPPGVY